MGGDWLNHVFPSGLTVAVCTCCWDRSVPQSRIYDSAWLDSAAVDTSSRVLAALDAPRTCQTAAHTSKNTKDTALGALGARQIPSSARVRVIWVCSLEIMITYINFSGKSDSVTFPPLDITLGPLNHYSTHFHFGISVQTVKWTKATVLWWALTSLVLNSHFNNSQILWCVYCVWPFCCSPFLLPALLDGRGQVTLPPLISHSHVLSPWQRGSCDRALCRLSNPFDKIASTVYSTPLTAALRGYVSRIGCTQWQPGHISVNSSRYIFFLALAFIMMCWC